MEPSVITRTVTVAPGRLAPGHLGELTQQVPFELVDAALAETGRVQSRIRDLPARVVVYLLVAGCLFAELGYGQVWRRLCAGLDGLPVATPTASALTQARRRLGPTPLRALFELLAGPAPTAATSGVRVGGLLVCAIDGTTLSVADTPANLGVYSTQPGHHGGSGYPLLRLVALVACGTRSLIDVVFGPTSSGETTMTMKLAGRLGAGMLVLGDRNLTTAALTGRIAASGAQLLGRCKANRKLPVLGRLGGRVLAVAAGWGPGPRRRRRDHHRHRCRPGQRQLPADHHPDRPPQLARDGAGGAVPPTLGDRNRVSGAEVQHPGRPGAARPHPRRHRPRGPCPAGLLPAPTAGHDRCHQQPSWHRPDRASFTVALNTARDQLIQAAGVIAGARVDLVAKIGRAVLDNLLADRRLRVSPRIVKRAISNYNARGPHITRTSYKATVSIDIPTRLPP